MPSPHDALVRRFLSRPAAAAGLLRTFEPALASHLDLEATELVPGSFIGEDLSQRTTDLLFRAPIGAGGAALVYVLLEHQSSTDPWMPLRMLTYQERIWSSLRERAPSEEGALPPILPLVLYTGAHRWTAPLDLADLIAASPFERPHLRYRVHCLRDHRDEEMAQWHALDHLSRAVLYMLKVARAADVLARVRHFAALAGLSGIDRHDLRTLMCYVAAVRRNREVSFMNDNLRLDPEDRQLAEDLYDVWTEAGRQRLHDQAWEEGRQEGREEGRQEGREEGREEGRQAGREEGREEGRAEGHRMGLLVRLEDLGDLTPERRRRIEAAAPEQLAHWAGLRRLALLPALDADPPG